MKHVGTQPIETARLLLRRMRAEDGPAMYQNWATDPEVTRYMRWSPHQNVEESQKLIDEWVAAYTQEDHYLWGIELKATGELIGSLGIMKQEDHEDFEPGYCIGRNWWGQGYMSEALAAAVDYFIQNTGVTRMQCCHAVGNTGSQKVMKRAGFVYDHDATFKKFDGTELPSRCYIKYV